MATNATIPEPSASRREQKKAETKQNLIDAAIDLYLNDGPDAATVHAITKNAGVSPRTFHNYFERRDDVFAYYLHDVFENFARRVKEVATDHRTGRTADILRDTMWIYCSPLGPESGDNSSQISDPITPDVRKFKPLLIMLEHPHQNSSGDSLEVDLPTLTEPGTQALCEIDPNLTPFDAFLLLDVAFSIALRAMEAAMDERLAGDAAPRELYDRAFDMLASVDRS
ncbi:TetR/AcrR family transcriptional regulator [uncultured Corynebacterium sp.]|uniref:TetR/AcrR family transcriptional regulator n=1 Tax=uncultured Corynebacterium sp. TaxID=159447 RepID=UPI0025CF9943|nr:TetR/AcrR family transcriptional regulator [uncultured Corynebacterium sp.]